MFVRDRKMQRLWHAPVLAGLALLLTLGLGLAAATLRSAELGITFAIWLLVILAIGLVRGLSPRAKALRPPTESTPSSALRGEPKPDLQPSPQHTSNRSIAAVSIQVPRPDLDPLLALTDKHAAARDRRARQQSERHCEQYRAGVRDAFVWNFANIQSYLDDVLMIEAPERFASLATDVDQAALALSIGCWSVGYEFQQQSPERAALLYNESNLSLASLPRPQRDLVEPAIGFAHWVFVSVFDGYYASAQGESVRHERDGHLFDAHQSFSRAALKCFQAGLDPTPLPPD